MPPSKSHEDAIIVIKGELRDEFDIEERNFIDYPAGYFFNLRPDITFKNPKTGRFIVVEVGNTDAEKIAKYLGMKHIEQIRWYTKHNNKSGVGLSGQWFTDDLSKTYIHRSACRFRIKENDLRRETEYIDTELRKIGLMMDSFVCCSGCGQHIRLKDVHIINYRARDYGVCLDCKDEGYFTTISSQREELYHYITEKRMVRHVEPRPTI